MAEPRVTMYSTRICPYCVAAKRLLDRDGIAFQEIDLSFDHELRQQLTAETGWRTVPMIFIDGTLVGGYTELMALRSRGGLDGLTA